MPGLASSVKKILVVDDNRDGADTLAMVLEFMGYLTDTAYDGQQAVDRAEAFLPDAIVMDINMPVMDGYRAAQTLRRNPETQAVILIALTAQCSAEAKAEAAQSGFDVHLTKPVAGEELAQTLQQVMPGR